jgi:hypothetical protein
VGLWWVSGILDFGLRSIAHRRGAEDAEVVRNCGVE